MHYIALFESNSKGSPRKLNTARFEYIRIKNSNNKPIFRQYPIKNKSQYQTYSVSYRAESLQHYLADDHRDHRNKQLRQSPPFYI